MLGTPSHPYNLSWTAGSLGTVPCVSCTALPSRAGEGAEWKRQGEGRLKSLAAAKADAVGGWATGWEPEGC